MTGASIAIFCRWPEPGKVKTRLIPSFGAEGAAAIYRKLLAHTIEVVKASGIPFELRAIGAPVEAFQAWLGEGIRVVDQGDGGLTERLSRVAPPAIVIGSDCPGLTAQHLWAAHDTLATEEMVIGPATDGGYYLLGYNRDARFAFKEMPWSTDQVYEETLRRFVAHGIRPAVMPELADIDTANDLDAWPDFLP